MPMILAGLVEVEILYVALPETSMTAGFLREKILILLVRFLATCSIEGKILMASVPQLLQGTFQ